jgi:drug/metabolite transporter (DMT)-like permease
MKHVQNHVAAITYMVVGIAAMVTMDAMAKLLMTTDAQLSPILLIGIRSAIIVTLIVAYYAATQNIEQITPKRPIVQLARGAMGFLAPVCYFKSLQTLPIADASVIFFSSIFIVTALSWPLLKERVGIHRWSAVVIGFVGVVVAMQPQGGGNYISYVYCLISSLAYALLFIKDRKCYVLSANL